MLAPAGNTNCQGSRRTVSIDSYCSQSRDLDLCVVRPKLLKISGEEQKKHEVQWLSSRGTVCLHKHCVLRSDDGHHSVLCTVHGVCMDTRVPTDRMRLGKRTNPVRIHPSLPLLFQWWCSWHDIGGCTRLRRAACSYYTLLERVLKVVCWYGEGILEAHTTVFLFSCKGMWWFNFCVRSPFWTHLCYQYRYDITSNCTLKRFGLHGRNVPGDDFLFPDAIKKE